LSRKERSLEDEKKEKNGDRKERGEGLRLRRKERRIGIEKHIVNEGCWKLIKKEWR
jgi:hypothetical protein